MPIRFEIIDDNGLLALVDASRYQTFVNPEWTYETLWNHFRSQMAQQAILVWDAGDGGGDYRIEVHQGITDRQGFRSAIGALRSEAGQLHVASYTALTMAAQFDDELIPATHEADIVFRTLRASVRVRIVQTYDPAKDVGFEGGAPHFIIEWEPGDAAAWDEVQWHGASAEPN